MLKSLDNHNSAQSTRYDSGHQFNEKMYAVNRYFHDLDGFAKAFVRSYYHLRSTGIIRGNVTVGQVEKAKCLVEYLQEILPKNGKALPRDIKFCLKWTDLKDIEFNPKSPNQMNKQQRYDYFPCGIQT